MAKCQGMSTRAQCKDKVGGLHHSSMQGMGNVHYSLVQGTSDVCYSSG